MPVPSSKWDALEKLHRPGPAELLAQTRLSNEPARETKAAAGLLNSIHLSPFYLLRQFRNHGWHFRGTAECGYPL